MRTASRWVFGYGSLVWRPAFAYRDRVPGFVRGFSRRFWQGSPDHRGVPHAPGRVVTLVPDGDALCWGMAYRVDDADWDAVVRELDERESGGFERHELLVGFADAGRPAAPALVYVAVEGNPNFLGPAPFEQIVAQVRGARGRSGSNADYVARLAQALRDLDRRDEHVFALADALASG